MPWESRHLIVFLHQTIASLSRGGLLQSPFTLGPISSSFPALIYSEQFIFPLAALCCHPVNCLFKGFHVHASSLTQSAGNAGFPPPPFNCGNIYRDAAPLFLPPLPLPMERQCSCPGTPALSCPSHCPHPELDGKEPSPPCWGL